MELKLQILMNL